MPRTSLILLASLTLCATAHAGVEIGGNLPPGLSSSVFNGQRVVLRGQLRVVRWVSRSGRRVSQPVSMPMGEALNLEAPRGEWTDVELVFDGEPRLGGREVPVETLTLTLDEPLVSSGESVVLRPDLSGLDGLDLSALSADALASALSDAALASIERSR